jgi:hypothetical protein
MSRVAHVGGQIASPVSDSSLKIVIRCKRVRDRIVYLQITRTVAPRYHAFAKPAHSRTRTVGLRSRRLRGCYPADVAAA